MTTAWTPADPAGHPTPQAMARGALRPLLDPLEDQREPDAAEGGLLGPGQPLPRPRILALPKVSTSA